MSKRDAETTKSLVTGWNVELNDDNSLILARLDDQGDWDEQVTWELYDADSDETDSSPGETGWIGVRRDYRTAGLWDGITHQADTLEDLLRKVGLTS